MRVTRSFKACMTGLACLGLLAGQIVQAAGPLQMPIQDVALQSGGVIHGQVVDGQAIAQPQTRVAVTQQGEAVAMTHTDAEGRFVVKGLSAGVYEIQTVQAGAAYRLWAPDTAPPIARDSVLLVQDQRIVRGIIPHHGGPPVAAPPRHHNYLAWLANPWVLAAIVAGAIAIPLAVDGDAS